MHSLIVKENNECSGKKLFVATEMYTFVDAAAHILSRLIETKLISFTFSLHWASVFFVFFFLVVSLTFSFSFSSSSHWFQLNLASP